MLVNHPNAKLANDAQRTLLEWVRADAPKPANGGGE
jgi:hypothetical protein